MDRSTEKFEVKNLNTEYIGHSIVYKKITDSTNTECKRLCDSRAEEGLTVVAEKQTAGRGRLGRQWDSPEGTGIWMSVMLKPQVNPERASKVTILAAAAVYMALKDMGIDSGIKWPNDIVIGSKKICGILTEMKCTGENIDYVVVGIGINVNTEKFPEDLAEKATSLKIETGQFVDRNELIGRILTWIEVFYQSFRTSGDINKVIEIVRQGSIVLGKDVLLIRGNEEIQCKVRDIDNDGELLVEYKEDGSVHRVISGEISIRGLYGYI